eukprot:TRINITY_DN3307_c0_g3_i4.p2 TRINITY_DN3307_c0_g3~~TRINITY_DN3307_c0_g3_i4.p2  ORF type:complete len:285 (+),score=30.85 TRINITY_DN3307_c0_g3_i4:106-960(+)
MSWLFSAQIQYLQSFLKNSSKLTTNELFYYTQKRYKKLKKKNPKKLPKRIKPFIMNKGQYKWKWDTTVRNAWVPMPNHRLPRIPKLPHIYKANTPNPYFFWTDEGYQTDELIDRINNLSVQRRAGTSSLCLTHLYRKTEEAELLRKGLTCARSGYITRVRQKLFGWESYVSQELINKSIELDVSDVGVEALERSWYYGFKPDLDQHEILMQRGFEKKDIGAVIRVYNAMKVNQIQPGNKVAEMLTGILMEMGKQKAATDVVNEFVANDFEISEQTKQKVSANSQ